MARIKSQPRFAVCVKNAGCDDLQIGKLYRVLPDAEAEAEGHLRIIDESGEDYLYPIKRFIEIQLPPADARKLRAATSSK